MRLSEDLELLRALVAAHGTLRDGDHEREPILFLRHSGGSSLMHHAFGEHGAPRADETAIKDLAFRGLLDLDYLDHGWQVTPTVEGRALCEQLDRMEDPEPAADLTALVTAVEAQAAAVNKLAWPAVRPVLAAVRRYWEEGGLADEGVRMMPLLAAIPDGMDDQFVATIRSFVRAGYLEPTTDLSIAGVPAFIALTHRAFQDLDGWPGASGPQLVENLLAVITERTDREDDPDKKRRLHRLGDALRELGVQVTAEVLAKTMTGG